MNKMYVLVDHAYDKNWVVGKRFEIIETKKTFNYQANWRYVERNSTAKKRMERVKKYLESVWGA